MNRPPSLVDEQGLIQSTEIQNGADLLVRLFLIEFSQILRPFCFVYDETAGALHYTTVISDILSQLCSAATSLSAHLQDVSAPFPIRGPQIPHCYSPLYVLSPVSLQQR